MATEVVEAVVVTVAAGVEAVEEMAGSEVEVSSAEVGVVEIVAGGQVKVDVTVAVHRCGTTAEVRHALPKVVVETNFGTHNVPSIAGQTMRDNLRARAVLTGATIEAATATAKTQAAMTGVVGIPVVTAGEIGTMTETALIGTDSHAMPLVAAGHMAIVATIFGGIGGGATTGETYHSI